MKVLVCCEESQRVCLAFRNLGHLAFSCDLKNCSGGHPEFHICDNCLPILDGCCDFRTMDGKLHSIDSPWDLIIAFPPCTYLTRAAARFYYDEDTGPWRLYQRGEAIKFVARILLCNCNRIAVENPVGVLSSAFRKPDQIIQPYFFGDPYMKTTCLWLKGLPKLVPDFVPSESTLIPSEFLDPGEWRVDSLELLHLSPEQRSTMRSKTFPGVARAMAEQWGIL